MFRGKALLVDTDSVFYCKGLSLYKFDKQTLTHSLFVRLPSTFLQSLFSSFDLSARLLRAQVHHMVADGQGGFYVIYLNSIIRISETGEVQGSLVKLYGSRPLCVTVFEHKLIYGEYTSNETRESVGIYSFDGFEHVRQLGVQGVRHIHGVFKDPYSSQLYITTGDYGDEAGIWYLDLNNKKLEPVLVGGQQSRAVQLLFDSSFIYFGTDTPLEQNYIYKLSKTDYKLTKVVSVSSSVFYGTKLGEDIYFGTVIEPSTYNKTKNVELWRLNDNGAKLVECFQKDIFSMKYFQYGQITFPNYVSQQQKEQLWISHLSTKNSGTVQSFKSTL